MSHAPPKIQSSPANNFDRPAQGVTAQPSHTAVSWNPHVQCPAVVTTLTAIFNGRYNSTNGGALPYGSTYGLVPNVPQVFSASSGFQSYKRALPSPYTGGGGFINLPCTALDWNATASGPTFVEIDGLTIDETSRILDRAAGGDCSSTFTSYNVLNGVTSMGGTYCDEYANLDDPAAYTGGCQASNTQPHVCIHEEIDNNWKGAGYCGAGTACDNNTFDAIRTGTMIDVQGFLYWDPHDISSGGHNWSGWELHPLTAWRPHSATVEDFTVTASPTSVAVSVGSPGNSTITITALNGFSGIVDFTSNSTACTVSPTSVTGSGSATLSCTFSSPSTIHIAVTGTSGSLSHSATVTYTVQDFAISAPSSLEAGLGVPFTANFTIAALNGFAGTVSFSDNISPDLSCGPIFPSTINGSGTGMVSCIGYTSGDYTLAVTGTSGTITHSVSIQVAVQPGSVGGQPFLLTSWNSLCSSFRP